MPASPPALPESSVLTLRPSLPTSEPPPYTDTGKEPPCPPNEPFRFEAPWITFNEDGNGERTAPQQSGPWVLEPYYKFCTPFAVNPALDLVYSTYKHNCSPDLRHKPGMEFLRKRFPFPVWLHILTFSPSIVDGGNIPTHLQTNAFLVLDIITTQQMTYARRKHILNTRLPTLGISTQPKSGSVYTTPTVPEVMGFELNFCLETHRDDYKWAQELYGGLVAKKLSALYENNPWPNATGSPHPAMFWHYHPFKTK